MTIRTGIGGWTYAEWRDGTFFPVGLVQRRELEFASRAVGRLKSTARSIACRSLKSYRKWRDETPEGFVFALKGSRFVTNRKELASAGEAIESFMNQGLTELGDRLGPICWQLATTKRFAPDDIAAFLALLPREWEGIAIRHAIEVGHESFACSEFVDLAREARVAIVWSDHPERTPIADRTADFAYMRLQGMRAECPTGYDQDELDRWRRICQSWANGHAPDGLPYRGNREESRDRPGDVFVFMINGAKERAPAAAMALADLLRG